MNKPIKAQHKHTNGKVVMSDYLKKLEQNKIASTRKIQESLDNSLSERIRIKQAYDQLTEHGLTVLVIDRHNFDVSECTEENLIKRIKINKRPFRPDDAKKGWSWKVESDRIQAYDYIVPENNYHQALNLGIIGGYDDLVIIDFDRLDLFDLWAEQHKELIAKCPIATTGKGKHVYVKCPEIAFSSSRFEIEDEYAGEIKAHNSYVVAPGSVHGNGYAYEWFKGHSLDDMPIPIISLEDLGIKVKMLERGNNPSGEIKQYAGKQSAYMTRLLAKARLEISMLVGGGDGLRACITKWAYTLGGHVANGSLDFDETLAYVTDLGVCQGLKNPQKAQEMVRNCILDGVTKPFPLKNDQYDPDVNAKRLLESLNNHQKDIFTSTNDDHDGHAECVLSLYAKNYFYADSLGVCVWVGTHWSRALGSAKLNIDISRVLRARRVLGMELTTKGIEKWLNDQQKIEDEISKLSKSFINRESKIASLESDLKQLRSNKPKEHPLSKLKISYQMINGIANLVISRVAVDFTKFSKPHEDYLNCANGIVDLRTKKVMPHDRRQYFFYCIDIPYNPAAIWEDWQDFVIKAIVPTDLIESDSTNIQPYIDTIMWLQKFAGYCLTGHTNEQILLWLWGPKRSGKGTFVQCIRNILGNELSGSINFDTLCAKNANDNRFDFAPLKDCRLVEASESDKQAYLRTSLVNNLTGNDPLRTSFKGKDSFSFVPEFKIILQSNYRVRADSYSDALWERVKVVQFPNSHAGNENTRLKRDLLQNRQGILAWLVEGAYLGHADRDKGIKLGDTNLIKAEVNEHRLENDPLQLFLNEYCEIDYIDIDSRAINPDSELRVITTELHELYKEVFGNNDKYRSMSKFINALKSKGYNYFRTSKRIKNKLTGKSMPRPISYIQGITIK